MGVGRWATLGAVVSLLGACSTPPAARSSTPRRPPGSAVSTIPAVPVQACPARLRSLVAGLDGTRTLSFQGQFASGLVRCTYVASAPGGLGCTRVTVDVSTQPQSYFTFQRWEVESSQNATWSHDPTLYPQPVPGMGLEADWIPGTRTFGTATETVWVTVYLTCGGPPAQDLPFAEALAGEALASAGGAGPGR